MPKQLDKKKPLVGIFKFPQPSFLSGPYFSQATVFSDETENSVTYGIAFCVC